MNKSTLSYSLLALLSIGFKFSGQAQNVAINTTGNQAYACALLDLSNNNIPGNSGFLPPYVTLPAVATTFGLAGGTPSQLSGLLVYNTNANLSGPGLYTWYYNTGSPALSTWIYLGTSGAVTGAGTLNYLARWTPNGTTLGIGVTQDNGTSVGINTAPVATQMLTAAEATAANIAILGQNTAGNGASTGIGVEGLTAQSGGYGVYGLNTATGANATGVYGSVTGSGTGDIGVKGSATMTAGTGVEGVETNPGASGGYGVQGLISGAGGGQQYGVYGASTITVGNGYGVEGSATGNTPATNYGGYFQAANTSGSFYGVVVPNNGGFTGLYTSTPQSTLDVFGSVGTQISSVAISANTTLDGTYSTVLANPTAGTFTVTLPTAGATNIRRSYTIVYSPSAATANAVTIQALTGNIYTGTTANASLSLTGGSITVQSNGGSWYTTNDWSGTTTPLSGAGTLNYLSRWTPNGTTLGNGITQDNGTEVGISTAAYCFCAGNGLLDVIGNATNVTAIEGSTPQAGGYGIEGLNTATAGAPIGVYGAANGAGSSGIGVEGNSLITGGTGVEGISNNLGVSGGTAVSGLAMGNGGGQQYALYGSSTVTAGNGYGVFGQSIGAAATNYGGYFNVQNGTIANYPVIATGGNSGFGVIAPVNTMDIFGSVGHQISGVALTANTTLDGTYSTILVNPTGGAFTVTLPTAGATNIRRFYTIVYSPSAATVNAVTIQAVAGSIYTGSTANASLSLTGGSITVQSNGANWYTTNDWGGGTPITGAGTLNYLARWTPNGATLGIGVTQDNGTTVGINVAPVATQMLTSAEATAANIAILGQNTAGSGASTGIGVEGLTAQAGGYGVFGNNTATSVGAIGVFGTANGAGSFGIGVEGSSTLATGIGVEGTNTAGNIGVEGITSGATTGGIGVQASNTASGAGVQYGLNASVTGNTATGTEYGVYSLVSGTASNNYGGSFLVSGGTASNYGVNASNISTSTGNQYGVYGSTSGNTVTGTAYGIYGTSTGTATNNYAGYFTASGATNNYGIVVSNPASNSGIGVTAPVNTMDIFGSVGTQMSTVALTAATTLNGTESTVLVNPTGGAFTVTLPTAAAANIRRFYTIVYSPSAVTANAVTIQATAGSIYTGATPNASLSLTAGSITVQSNGTNWYTTNDWTGSGITGSGTLNYLARWTPNGTTLGIGVTQDNGTTVGINVAPVATQMLTAAQTTAADIAILGQNTAAAGAGAGIGMEGITAQSGGYGVFGNNTATSGSPIGLYGTANGVGATGIGVEGNSTVTGGTGVEGISTNGGGSGGYGVQGLISGAGGGQQYALYGSSTVTAGNGYGLNAQATGAAAINYGGNFTASNGTGTNYGVNSAATGGVGSTNYAGYFNATGAGTDYGVVVPNGGGNSGFGTNAPVSTTDINGSYGVGTFDFTTGTNGSSYALTALANASTFIATPLAVGSAYTLQLPSGTANIRRIYTIVYYGSGLGTINITSPVAGVIKENGATVATFSLSQGSVTFQSDGTNWEVLNVTTSNTFGSFVGIKYVTVTTAATAFDAGTNSILVKVIGGGGAGSGGSTTGACVAQTDYAGTGGGAGGYVEGFLNGLTGSSTYAVTIGAGGVGTATCNTAGGSGGNTILTIANPAVTYTGNGGTGGPSNEADNVDSYKAGGAGGTATSTAVGGTYITIPGATGASSVISSTGIHLVASGCGAGTTFGPGGSALTGRSLEEPGVSAVAFGAGGGGAINAQTPGNNSAGGNGYQGVVIIYEYQ